MRFEEALKALREGKRLINGSRDVWFDVFYIEDGELTSDRYEEGQCTDKNVPVMLSDYEIMSDEWEVVEDESD